MNWETVKLNSIISRKISGEWGAEASDGNSVFVLRTTNFKNNGEICYGNVVKRQIDSKKVENKKMLPGDILIEKSGGSPSQPVGRVVYFTGDRPDVFLCNNFTSILRPNEKVYPKFLFHFLFSIYQKGKVLKYQNKTTGIINLKLDRYLTEEIPLPPLAEQKRIARILDKADEIRKKRQQAIKECDEFLKATFLDMFGDNLQSKEVKLSTICHLITDGVHAKPNYTNDGVPFISVKNITKGFLSFENCKFISFEDHQKYKKRCYPKLNDILYTKVGATYGRASVIDDSREFSLYVSVCLIKPVHEKINAFYLRAALNSHYMKRQADRSIKGIGVPDLHLIEIKNFMIKLPPLPLQEKFAKIVEKTEAMKTRMQESMKELDDNFNNLMQRAFKGEL